MTNKRQVHSVYKRIQLFKINNPVEADLLMAIKPIGNAGSHPGEQLNKG